MPLPKQLCVYASSNPFTYADSCPDLPKNMNPGQSIVIPVHLYPDLDSVYFSHYTGYDADSSKLYDWEHSLFQGVQKITFTAEAATYHGYLKEPSISGKDTKMLSAHTSFP